MTALQHGKTICRICEAQCGLVVSTRDNRIVTIEPNKEHVALSAELTVLDKEINSSVLNARHALLEQTRVLRAQVSAKKGYEQANTMKISSYS